MGILNNKKTLKLTDQQALDLYKSSNDEWKQILEDNYGKDFFKPKDITNKVNSILSLADHLDIEIDELFIFDRNTKDPHERFINACNILPKVAELYNEGTKLNWKNNSEYKYIPYKYFSGGFYYKSPKLSKAELDRILNDGLLQRTFAIEELRDKLSKHYDKNDVGDIIEILTK